MKSFIVNRSTSKWGGERRHKWEGEELVRESGPKRKDTKMGSLGS